MLSARECIYQQNTNWKSLTPFNIQSEFTALHSATHDFTNLKQEIEQIRIFKIYKYIIKMG